MELEREKALIQSQKAAFKPPKPKPAKVKRAPPSPQRLQSTQSGHDQSEFILSQPNRTESIDDLLAAEREQEINRQYQSRMNKSFGKRHGSHLSFKNGSQEKFKPKVHIDEKTLLRCDGKVATVSDILADVELIK